MAKNAQTNNNAAKANNQSQPKPQAPKPIEKKEVPIVPSVKEVDASKDEKKLTATNRGCCRKFASFILRFFSAIIMTGVVAVAVYYKHLSLFWLCCSVIMYYEFMRSGYYFVLRNFKSTGFKLKMRQILVFASLFINSLILVAIYCIESGYMEFNFSYYRDMVFSFIFNGVREICKSIFKFLEIPFIYGGYITIIEAYTKMITLKVVALFVLIRITILFKCYIFSINSTNYFQPSLIMLGWAFIGCLLFAVVCSANLLIIKKGYQVFFIGFLAIIINDVFAYIFGVLFGKKKLIAVSPNKTVGGYRGGAFATLILVPILAVYFLSTDDFFPIEKEIYRASNMRKLCYGLIIAFWASFVGPTGGFIASLIKRSAGIKDFSNLIPGHGGVLDRCDCQIMMAPVALLALNNLFYQVKGKKV